MPDPLVSRPLPLLPLLLALPLVVACPSRLPEVDPSEATTPKPTDDPRVIQIGSDFYAAEDYREEPPPPAKPGAGKPDESNGRCRLYAPRLDEPECCSLDYGLDAKTVMEACDLDLYLGESFHFTCGYYFHRQDGRETWLRMSLTQEGTTREAARAHDERTRRAFSLPDFASTPVPGVPGAYWSSHGDLNWAFIPGWSRVRGLGWHRDSCSPEGIARVIAQLAEAPEPKDPRRRPSLIPAVPPG